MTNEEMMAEDRVILESKKLGELHNLDKLLYKQGKVEKTPSDVLKKASELYGMKESRYGDNWKRIGPVLSLLFKGFNPISPKDWDKLHIITMIIVKLTRIVNGIKSGGNYYDSKRDLVVYAAMLDSLED